MIVDGGRNSAVGDLEERPVQNALEALDYYP